MKPFYLAAAFMLFTACTSTKKSIVSNTIEKDSSVIRNVQRKQDSISYVKTTLIKDTVITIPARSIRDTLTAEQLQPAFAKDGTAVKRTYTADTKATHAFLNVLPGGKVEYGCDADSLSVIIRSLVRENTELHSRYDSIQQAYQINNKSTFTGQHSSVTRTRSFLAAMWPYLLVLAVIVVAAYLVKRFLKWPL